MLDVWFLNQVIGKMPSKSREVKAEPAVKLSPELPDSAPLFFPGNSPTAHPTQPELKQPPAQPQDILSKNVSVQHPYSHKLACTFLRHIKVGRHFEVH